MDLGQAAGYEEDEFGWICGCVDNHPPSCFYANRALTALIKIIKATDWDGVHPMGQSGLGQEHKPARLLFPCFLQAFT
jgi:hypothetical protein